jgi:hypothetical protein
MNTKKYLLLIVFSFFVPSITNATPPKPSTIKKTNIVLPGTATLLGINAALYGGYALYRAFSNEKSYSFFEDLRVGKRVYKALITLFNPQTNEFEYILSKEIVKNHKLFASALLVSLVSEGVILCTGGAFAISELFQEKEALKNKLQEQQKQNKKREEELNSAQNELKELEKALKPIKMKNATRIIQKAFRAFHNRPGVFLVPPANEEVTVQVDPDEEQAPVEFINPAFQVQGEE